MWRMILHAVVAWVLISLSIEDESFGCLNGSCNVKGRNRRSYRLGPPQCAHDQWMCTSGQCIPDIQRCDVIPDCWDMSDEFDCDSLACNEGYLACDSGECMVASKLCNGVLDCFDGSDESISLCGETTYKMQIPTEISSMSPLWTRATTATVTVPFLSKPTKASVSFGTKAATPDNIKSTMSIIRTRTTPNRWTQKVTHGITTQPTHTPMTIKMSTQTRPTLSTSTRLSFLTPTTHTMSVPTSPRFSIPTISTLSIPTIPTMSVPTNPRISTPAIFKLSTSTPPTTSVPTNSRVSTSATFTLSTATTQTMKEPTSPRLSIPTALSTPTKHTLPVSTKSDKTTTTDQSLVKESPYTLPVTTSHHWIRPSKYTLVQKTANVTKLRETTTNAYNLSESTISNHCRPIGDTYGFCRRRYRGYYRDPENCENYFVCEWGLLHMCQCPKSTRWDVRILTCVWKFMSPCSSSDSTKLPLTSNYMSNRFTFPLNESANRERKRPTYMSQTRPVNSIIL